MKFFLKNSALFAVVLSLFWIGCQEPITNPDEQLAENSETHSLNREGACGTTTWDLTAGQTIVVGTVTVENDAENVYVTYALDTQAYPDACFGTLHAWVGYSLDDLPNGGTSRTPPGQLCDEPGGACFDTDGATSHTFTIPLADLGITDINTVCNQNLIVVTHAEVDMDCDPLTTDNNETGYGGPNPGDGPAWWFYGDYTICCDSGPDPEPEPECETAFAYGNENANCFSDYGFERWGWSNGPLSPGSYSFPIYAGAGQCDLSKGTLVGTLTVDYDGSEANVTFDMDAGYVMDETHLYIGSEAYPYNKKGKPTVAPGQYPYQNDLDNADSDSYTVTGLSGDIYVIAHAVVCEAGETCDEWIVYGSNLNGGSDPLDDAIYAYDLKAQTRTLVYDPTPIDGNQNYPNANAYDADNQRIYFGTDDGRLYYHEIGSGTHVQVEGGATSGSFGTMACGSWYNGKFYYVQNGTNRLYEVSIVNDVATRTQIGTVPTSNGYGDIVFDPANPGVFIGSAGSNPVWYVYDLNTNTSQVLTANVTDNHKQLAYGSDGVLYAVEAVSGQFYSVEYDTNAGTVTLTAGWDSPYTFTDLASGPQCQ